MKRNDQPGGAGQNIPAIPILVVGITLFALLAVLNSTLVGIYRGAIYLYADRGEVAPQFEQEIVTQAFAPRG